MHGSSDVTVPRLSGFSIVSPKNVEVEYADGSKFSFSFEFLRVHSPAVDGKIRSIGGEKVISGRRYVGTMSAEQVGNYGVRLVFDDLHRRGIPIRPCCGGIVSVLFLLPRCQYQYVKRQFKSKGL